MDNWIWWILTCALALYFVILLLEFNRPSQKLMEQIDVMETRRREMELRLVQAQEETTTMKNRLEEIQLQWDALEERRKEILPEANARLMVPIPAGSFVMGGEEEESPRNELPGHVVHLPDYYIGRQPVTNQDYREFVQCTDHRPPIHWQRDTYPAGLGKHPVVNVSWQDAQTYAEWRGARLPTEAEWEKAARGTDERRYPWGDRFQEGEYCNANNPMGTTTPVDEYPLGCSPYGVWDMVGNVYEWCADYYEADYYRISPGTHPKGPDGGQDRVIRGSCYMDTRGVLRATNRGGGTEVSSRDNIGFRIAMTAKETAPVPESLPPSADS